MSAKCAKMGCFTPKYPELDKQLQIDNNLSGKMARCVDPLEISLDEYRVIFGDSDEEGTKDIEEMVLTSIFWVLMRMVRKVMKKRTVKVATKKPLTATMKKNNNGQLTSFFQSADHLILVYHPDIKHLKCDFADTEFRVPLHHLGSRGDESELLKYRSTHSH
ncbi:hypothetical protein pdam_00006367 [Pocillopora damicornis]|uniref:Uncharacterized protein n=1 Tax=Pocillopora damicornis TaxID=46731 RepID=A0A3M6TQW2_POCDA|nr:hypothetical protein pdam_00006367 [Pocillopora damicornis]